MRLPRTARFDEESARFSLCFSCEDCAHFEARDERCRHEWPTALHRKDAGSDGELVFCKEFELC